LSSAPAELKQAIDDIDKARDVVDLLVVLLKICRRHASEVVAAGQDREMRRQIRQEAAQVAEKAASAFTSVGLSSTTRALAEAMLTGASDLVVMARALALGIDEAIVNRDPKVYVKACAKWQHQHELKENDPYPTPSVDLDAMYGDVGFSRRPRRNAATAVDRVGGLALWPSASNQPLRVIYDLDAGAYLDSALARRKTVSILAVVPNRDFGEFQPDEVSAKGFFHMHPLNTLDQNTRIGNGLQKAIDLDVDIMVTPELSSTDDTVPSIRAALAKVGAGGPRVVIVGGMHIETNTTFPKRRNRMSTIYAEPNSPVFEHDKIGEYVAGPWEEDIDRSTELRIHAGINWSMVTLICADLLDDAVVDAVADLCPQLVIVPSMSSKTGDFEMSMGAVIRKTQALVMVVNGPYDWPCMKPPPNRTQVPIVVVGMPFASSWITTMSPPPFDAPAYGVLFRSENHIARYIKL
jgi:hypothetical protein